jgi:hypothetical protein
VKRLACRKLPMDKFSFKAVVHHDQSLQFTGQNLAVNVKPFHFRLPCVELSKGCFCVLPFGQVVQLSECLVKFAFFRALSPPPSSQNANKKRKGKNLQKVRVPGFQDAGNRHGRRSQPGSSFPNTFTFHFFFSHSLFHAFTVGA